MHPNSTEQSGLNLPPPSANQAPINSAHESSQPTPDTAFANLQPQAPIPMPPALPVPATFQVTQPQAQTDDVSKTTSSSVPPVADDGDLIEKEWVHKAKSIVEKTREDPYAQSRELTEFRADYMQKRYNKTIKLSE